jgi:histone deacetylase complex regulatory component SIN3
MDYKNLISFHMKVLFDGHHDLILAFNEFLPEGYKINIEDGDEVA